MTVHRRGIAALVAAVAAIAVLTVGPRPAIAADTVVLGADGASSGFGAPQNRISITLQAWRLGSQILDDGSVRLDASYADLVFNYRYSCLFGMATDITLTSLFPTWVRFSCLVFGIKTLFDTGLPTGILFGEQAFELTESNNIFLPQGIITANIPNFGTGFLANLRQVKIQTWPPDNTGP